MVFKIKKKASFLNENNREVEIYCEEDMNESYWVRVKFFSNSIRKKPPCFKLDKGIRYSPHLVVRGDGEYLGVSFEDGDVCAFDEEVDAIVVPLYENVDYNKLVKDVEFSIMEGPHIVGEGIVKEVFRFRSDTFYDRYEKNI